MWPAGLTPLYFHSLCLLTTQGASASFDLSLSALCLLRDVFPTSVFGKCHPDCGFSVWLSIYSHCTVFWGINSGKLLFASASAAAQGASTLTGTAACFARSKHHNKIISCCHQDNKPLLYNQALRSGSNKLLSVLCVVVVFLTGPYILVYKWHRIQRNI